MGLARCKNGARTGTVARQHSSFSQPHTIRKNASFTPSHLFKKSAARCFLTHASGGTKARLARTISPHTRYSEVVSEPRSYSLLPFNGYGHYIQKCNKNELRNLQYVKWSLHYAIYEEELKRRVPNVKPQNMLQRATRSTIIYYGQSYYKTSQCKNYTLNCVCTPWINTMSNKLHV